MHLLFNSLLIFATLSTTMIAGLVFTFSAVIMPGIGTLDDREFVRAFQAIDGIIQNGQPLFGLVWVGSIFSLFAVSILGFLQLDGFPKWLLLAANLLYIAGVQVPTFKVNLPHNDALQAISVAHSDEATVAAARNHFEMTWNRANHLRTVVATIVSLILILIVRLGAS
ncbi:MAG: anthrone oxygenase family protein [Verrucomicrobiota bacterium]